MINQVLLSNILAYTLGLIGLRLGQTGRQIVVGPLLACAGYSLANAQDLVAHTRIAGLAAWLMLFYVEHVLNTFFIVQYVLEDNSWVGAYRMLWNARWINTDRTAMRVRKGAQSSATVKSRDSSEGDDVKQSRLGFVFWRLSMVLLKYLVLQIWIEVGAQVLDLDDSDFTPSKRSIVRRIISQEADMNIIRECLVRAYTAINWLYEDWTRLSTIHDILAVIFVGVLQFDEPQDWPPLFGNIRHVVNLRTWFSQFWHLLIYRVGVSYALALLGGVVGLNMRNKSRVKTILITSIVFLLSGFNHFVQSWSISKEYDWRNLLWWTAQPVFLVIEDFVQAWCKKHCGWIQGEQYSIFRTYFGRIWVFTVFWWGILKVHYVSDEEV